MENKTTLDSLNLSALLSACERLKSAYDNQSSYDEFQYDFSLNGATEDVIAEYNKLPNEVKYD